MGLARHRLGAGALALGVLVAGCGKSGPLERGGKGTARLNPVVAVGPYGSAGQITKNTTRLGGATAIVDAAAVAQAVHPGLAAADRTQAVVLVNKDEFAAAMAASVLAGGPLGAPVLYGEPRVVPSATAQALAAMQPTGAAALDGAQVLAVGAVAVPKGLVVDQIPDRGPAAVAAEIEKVQTRIRGSAPKQVLVIDAQGPPSLAMPAAGLAAESGAPILMVSSVGVPAATVAVLRELGHPNIYAIGPTAAISAAVLAKLARLGSVKRIAGAGPAENSIEGARFSEGAEASEFGFGVHEGGHGLVFASAARPFDAPAAASLSANGDFGPLLVLEEPGAIPAAMATYLSDIQPAYSAQVPAPRSVYNRGWIIGDELAVSATVQDELDSALEIDSRGGASGPSYHS
jgi:hypothetical protein